MNKQQVLENVKIVVEEGADGVFLINHESGHEAELVHIYRLVREIYCNFWIGLNLLGVSNENAIRTVWNERSPGLWVDNAGIEEVYDQVILCNDAEQCLSLRGKLWSEELYFGGVAFKYQESVKDYRLVAQEASKFVDVITTSGDATGNPPDIKKIGEMREGMGQSFPFAVASGMTPENVGQYLDYLDCFLVATGINMKNDFYNFDSKKVRKFVKTIGN